MELEEAQVSLSVSCPTSGRQYRLEDDRTVEHTHTCSRMHVYTKG